MPSAMGDGVRAHDQEHKATLCRIQKSKIQSVKSQFEWQRDQLKLAESGRHHVEGLIRRRGGRSVF
jgi:hypothetical protein